MARRVSHKRPNYNPSQLPCTISGCRRWFRNIGGRTKHIRSQHQQQTAPCIPPNSGVNALSSPTRHAEEHYINMEASDNVILADSEPSNSFRSSSRLSSESRDESHLNFSTPPPHAFPPEQSSPLHAEPVNLPPITRRTHPKLNGVFFFLIHSQV